VIILRSSQLNSHYHESLEHIHVEARGRPKSQVRCSLPKLTLSHASTRLETTSRTRSGRPNPRAMNTMKVLRLGRMAFAFTTGLPLILYRRLRSDRKWLPIPFWHHSRRLRPPRRAQARSPTSLQHSSFTLLLSLYSTLTLLWLPLQRLR